MMQVLADDGVRVDVRVDGSIGAAVVLIAGFPLTREVWDEQAATLAQHCRVVRPNLRGTVKAERVNGPYLMERLAADVAAVLDALGIERAAVAGHSLGGYVAMAFARMFSERVSRIALICSRLAADTPEQAAARRDLADRVERENSMQPVVDAIVPRMFAARTLQSRPDLVDRVRTIASHVPPAGAAALLRGMALRSAAEDIACDLDVPAWIVAGGADAVIPIEEARANAAAFPRGRAVICEQSGHLPMLEEPETLAGALGAWLSE
ncbi:MAG: alpha/beta hydrolase [Candidatus Tumulicola sp.]